LELFFRGASQRIAFFFRLMSWDMAGIEKSGGVFIAETEKTV